MVRIPSFLSMEQFERRLEQPWTFFGLTALTVLMVAIDSTIVAVALPTLVRDLDTTLVLAAWTITAYALAQTVMLPMAGQLAEQFGQMRVFVACVSLFTVGSLLCALAPNVYALIVPRRWMTLFGLGLVFGAPVILRQVQMAAVLGVDFWLRDLIYSAAIKVSVLSRVVPVPSLEDLDAIYRAAGVLRAPAAPTSSVAVILQTFVSLVTYALIPSIGLMTFGLAVVVGMLAIVTAVRLVRLRPRVFLAGLHARHSRSRQAASGGLRDLARGGRRRHRRRPGDLRASLIPESPPVWSG